MPQRIQNFTNAHIAIFRPRRHDYLLATWNAENRIWLPYSQPSPLGLQLMRSTLHANNKKIGQILLKKGRGTDPGIMVDFTTTCWFLMSGDSRFVAPIVETPISRVPAAFKKTSYTAIQPFMHELPKQLFGLRDEKKEAILSPLVPIPLRIARLILQNAIESKEECPITMEPITHETSAVTTCFHCFDAAALQTWHDTHRNANGSTECPVCKQGCLFTTLPAPA